MKLHEYQAKSLLRDHGIPVPEGKVADSPEEAETIAREVGCPVMVKAQVLVGGRGKAGGVKKAADPKEAAARARDILGMKIKGIVVQRVLVVIKLVQLIILLQVIIQLLLVILHRIQVFLVQV